MAQSDDDDAPSNDASGPERWRLILHLHDGKQHRSVSLDFAGRDTLDAQLARLHPNPYDVLQLFEFRNERGELLAIVARAYVGHEIVAHT